MKITGISQEQFEFPFDTVALDYDRDFTQSRLGRWLRELVRGHLETALQPGTHVLELGCGTGEDAVWLAQRGIRVTATDGSAEMIARGRAKARSAGMGERVRFVHWDLARSIPSEIPRELESGYHGVFSNFGALNCLSDRRQLARALAPWLQPGAKAIFVVMGPWCPWEIAWHLLHGKARTAFRRLRKGVRAHIGHGNWIPVWYPSPRQLRSEFSPYFRCLQVVGIGAFLPPSYLHHLVDRFPGFFAKLRTFDLKTGHVFPLNWLNDHYLIMLEKQ